MRKKGAMFISFVIGIVLLTSAGCSFKPTEKDGKKVLENTKYRDVDFIKVVSFKKLNAQEREISGVKGYIMEYEAIIEFVEDICEGTGFIENMEKVYKKPHNGKCKDFFSFLFYDWELIKKGTRRIIEGKLKFEKTEKGWRGEDGNIY